MITPGGENPGWSKICATGAASSRFASADAAHGQVEDSLGHLHRRLGRRRLRGTSSAGRLQTLDLDCPADFRRAWPLRPASTFSRLQPGCLPTMSF